MNTIVSFSLILLIFFFFDTEISYQLLDYIYTAFNQVHLDGSPILHLVWFKYPQDKNMFALEYQFFFGDSILVSPVTEENVTSVVLSLLCILVGL